MDTSLLPALLDDRNASLWRETTQAFPVQVQLHPRTHHLFSATECQGYVFLAAPDCAPAPFTRELLHLHLRARRIFLTEYLVRCLREEPLLHWTFSATLFEQIGHCLEHQKIIPLFSAAGFDVQNFTADSHTPLCNPMLLQLIEGGLRKQVPSVISADLFIRTFIRIQCRPDPTATYGYYLERLQQADPTLYGLLQRFFAGWQSYEIDRYHPDHYSYTGLVKGFLHELGAWTILTIHAKEKKEPVCLT